MRIYIAGPMRGKPDLNYPAFIGAEEFIKEIFIGCEVVNPVKLNPDQSAKFSDCMRRDIQALCDCDSIYMLRGWSSSAGARLEYQVALALDMDIYYEDINETTPTTSVSDMQ